jgi:two-component system, sensor histidine kinase and response regulator
MEWNLLADRENQNRFYNLIQEVSLRFLDLDGELLEAEVYRSLEQTGRLFDLDRIFFYSFSEDHTIINPTYNWHYEETGPKKVFIRDELAYEFPWMMRRLKSSDYIAVENTQELSSEAFFEKERLTGEGVKSCLFIPLKTRGKLWAFMRLDSLRQNRVWTSEDIEILQVLGKILISNHVMLHTEKELNSRLYDKSLILDNSDVQIWSLKNATVYGAVNDAHARFFGKDKAELEYQDLYDIFPPETANLLCRENWELFQQKGEVARELWVHNCEGDKRLLWIKSKPKTDSYGNIEYLVCTAEDITEQRRIQDDLVMAKRAAEGANIAKGRFLANMSHEIRTPMNGIIGYLELVEGTELTPEQKEYIMEIRGASELLLYLLNDILDFSKIEEEKVILENIRFHLRSVVENTVMFSAPKAHEKGLKLSFNIRPDIPEELVGDPGRLKQVLNNLVNNSVKFTGEGEVTILVETEEEHEDRTLLRFEVRDTGIGISGEDLGRLFTPFTQVDASTTRKYGGTGLGLAISKKLVELMGGEISVDGRPGEGTVFRFTCSFLKSSCLQEFAAENTEPKPQTVRSEDGDRQWKPTILVVEDNEINRKLVLRMLEVKGLACDIAVNGLEALEACKRKKYDVVFMDCQMPCMDGYEATGRIREYEGVKRHTPIVAMTANAMEGDREKCLAAGMDEYLSKPIRSKIMLEAIYTYCKQ